MKCGFRKTPVLCPAPFAEGCLLYAPPILHSYGSLKALLSNGACKTISGGTMDLIVAEWIRLGPWSENAGSEKFEIARNELFNGSRKKYPVNHRKSTSEAGAEAEINGA